MDKAKNFERQFLCMTFIIADIFPIQYLALPLSPSLKGVYLSRNCI